MIYFILFDVISIFLLLSLKIGLIKVFELKAKFSAILKTVLFFELIMLVLNALTSNHLGNGYVQLLIVLIQLVFSIFIFQVLTKKFLAITFKKSLLIFFVIFILIVPFFNLYVLGSAVRMISPSIPKLSQSQILEIYSASLAPIHSLPLGLQVYRCLIAVSNSVSGNAIFNGVQQVLIKIQN
jgi:hypothetical protein